MHGLWVPCEHSTASAAPQTQIWILQGAGHLPCEMSSGHRKVKINFWLYQTYILHDGNDVLQCGAGVYFLDRKNRVNKVYCAEKQLLLYNVNRWLIKRAGENSGRIWSWNLIQRLPIPDSLFLNPVPGRLEIFLMQKKILNFFFLGNKYQIFSLILMTFA